MQKLILIFFCSLIGLPAKVKTSGNATAQEEHIQWMNLNEAAAGLQNQKKAVLIDLYTDWCSWCKVMDKKTYSNKNVQQYIQEKFYAVKVNAESKEALIWAGKTYQYNRNYKVNDFAVFITRGQLSFPTTIIIPADGSEPQAIPGYLETKDFELIAKYFGEGGYGKIPFDKYQKEFKPTW